MNRDRRNEQGFLHFVAGASAVLRIMLLILIVVLLIFIWRKAYSFGYALFSTEAEGTDSSVPLPEGLSDLISGLKGAS